MELGRSRIVAKKEQGSYRSKGGVGQEESRSRAKQSRAKQGRKRGGTG